MTTTALDLPVILPRGAECADCVDELGGELRRLRGVRDVTPDVARGLVHVAFDNELLAYDDLARDARRIGAAAHCAAHCPLDEHGHASCSCEVALEMPPGECYEQRLAHVTGLDCADCALKLEGALQHTPGVVSATTSFGASTLKVVFDPHEIAYDEVLARVQRLGYDTLEGRQARDRAGGAGGERSLLRESRTVLTAVSGLAVAAGFATSDARARYAVTPPTLPTSTFTPGPWVELIAMRWM